MAIYRQPSLCNTTIDTLAPNINILFNFLENLPLVTSQVGVPSCDITSGHAHLAVSWKEEADFQKGF